MIDAEAYGLAHSFEELKGSGAFQYIMDDLRTHVAHYEQLAVTAGPELETREVRNRITAWQARRQVLMGIELLFDEYERLKKQMDEELKNERAIEHERATRGSW